MSKQPQMENLQGEQNRRGQKEQKKTIYETKAEEEEEEEEEKQQQMKQEGLPPLESSPYLRYTDLEEYKRTAYGWSEGRLQPEPQCPSVGTDASTPTPTPTPHGSQAISKQDAAAIVDRKLKL